MPVTFGATTTLSGAGSWAYPDASSVIGLLIGLTATGLGPRVWGTEVPRYRDLGVYRPVSEAGALESHAVWHDEVVDYNLGKSPIQLEYDLSPGVTITATEILAETPPGGGGGFVVAPAIFANTTGDNSIPSSTWAQISTWNTPSVDTDHSALTMDTSGNITVHKAGLYRVSAVGGFGGNGDDPTAKFALYRNGSEDTPFLGQWDVQAGVWQINGMVEEPFSVADVMSLWGYHQNLNPAFTYGQWTVAATVLTP